jgi:hypothetical protein
MTNPLREYEWWLRRAEHLANEAVEAQRHDDFVTGRIYLDGVELALDVANEWKEQIK